MGTSAVNGLDDGHLLSECWPRCTGIVTGKPLSIGGSRGRELRDRAWRDDYRA